MDTRLWVIAIITTTGVLSILTFVALVISYIIILSTLRTRSSEGCRKALSTCGSHITVVFMFFLPLIFTYVPTADSVRNDKVFALFYTMIVPMFNPLIYTLRNTDMKNAMRKVWGRDKLSAGKWSLWLSCPLLDLVLSTQLLMLTRTTNTEGSCAVIQSWNPEVWSLHQPLSFYHLTETAYKGSGSDALWVLSSSDILEHSVLCIPWYDECISALFFRKSCEDYMVGFSDLFQETDNLEWDISHRAFLKHFFFFFFEDSTAIISKKQCQKFYKCCILFFFYINKSCS